VFKYCPTCGGEFQLWVSVCPDCKAALVESAVAVAPPTPPPPEELPHARELVCVERGDPWHLRELAEALNEQGISCRIDVHPPDAAIPPPARRGAATQTRFGLYVRAADRARAEQLRGEHLERAVPDAAGLAGEPGALLADCPACGAPLAEGATSCASCGLEFPELSAEE
jgi:hypothetical protein